jgi:hypothetical protein
MLHCLAAGGRCMENSNSRSLLLIGHPGHELRLYGWIAQTRPLVCILTDGSGSDGLPRVDATLAVLRDLGAPVGAICARLTDRAIYQHVLDGNRAVFDALRDAVAQLLVDAHIDTVVSDGIEGYNPTHDLCQAIASSAVARAARRRNARIEHLCIPLMGDPHRFADGAAPVRRSVDLDPAVFEKKMRTVQTYAQDSGATLQREVDETLRSYGQAAFRREVLFDAARPSWPEWSRRFAVEKPYYETYGRAQVAAGRYQYVIAFEDHMRPLIDHLHAAGAGIDAPASTNSNSINPNSINPNSTNSKSTNPNSTTANSTNPPPMSRAT